MSIRATVRVTGAAKSTITKLLQDLAMACSAYQDTALVNLPSTRIECDEIWSLCYAKAKNVPRGAQGSVRLRRRVDLDRDLCRTKLVPWWYVGQRNAEDAEIFMRDLASRLAHRVQLTTDGHKPYLSAVESAFGGDIDYAMLHKVYGAATGKSDAAFHPAH